MREKSRRTSIRGLGRNADRKEGDDGVTFKKHKRPTKGRRVFLVAGAETFDSAKLYRFFLEKV